MSAARNPKSTPAVKAFRGGVAATLAVAGLTLAGPVASAEAATARNGVCEAGEFCYYWGGSQSGSVSDFTASVSNYGTNPSTCYEFRGPGTGQNECLKNNAWSVWNRSSRAVTVYYNSGYTGTAQTFASGQKADLSASLKENNASHKFR